MVSPIPGEGCTFASGFLFCVETGEGASVVNPAVHPSTFTSQMSPLLSGLCVSRDRVGWAVDAAMTTKEGARSVFTSLKEGVASVYGSLQTPFCVSPNLGVFKLSRNENQQHVWHSSTFVTFGIPFSARSNPVHPVSMSPLCK